MHLRFVIVAGPPSSGKTSVMVHTIRHLQKDGFSIAACKIDCLETLDDERYRNLNIPVAVGLSDYICPDHFYVANLEEAWDWAKQMDTDILVLETAGLCHRCAPAVQDCLTICVVDHLAGLDTPKKIGPMLSTADIVAVTKGDIVSQAEREVFRHQVETVNPNACVIDVNGLNGKGSLRLKTKILKNRPMENISGKDLRYPMPGEPVSPFDNLTMLSGGQARALMVGDVAMISNAPVVLIDEIENAGIDRLKALEILTGQGKIVLVVTHDLTLTFMAGRRVVMKNGGMTRLNRVTPEEKHILEKLVAFEKDIFYMRDFVRNGGSIIDNEDINIPGRL